MQKYCDILIQLKITVFHFNVFYNINGFTVTFDQ